MTTLSKKTRTNPTLWLSRACALVIDLVEGGETTRDFTKNEINTALINARLNPVSGRPSTYQISQIHSAVKKYFSDSIKASYVKVARGRRLRLAIAA